MENAPPTPPARIDTDNNVLVTATGFTVPIPTQEDIRRARKAPQPRTRPVTKNRKNRTYQIKGERYVEDTIRSEDLVEDPKQIDDALSRQIIDSRTRGRDLPWTMDERAVDPFGDDPSTYIYDPYDFDGTLTGRPQPKVRVATTIVGGSPISARGGATTSAPRTAKSTSKSKKERPALSTESPGVLTIGGMTISLPSAADRGR